jgi:predicted DNA binding CopG/RHH family protein
MPKPAEPARTFRDEADERAYWERTDAVGEIDWSKAERVRLPNLEPSKASISLRLPVGRLERIKTAANKRDVPCQSLMKIWLAEKIKAADVE